MTATEIQIQCREKLILRVRDKIPRKCGSRSPVCRFQNIILTFWGTVQNVNSVHICQLSAWTSPLSISLGISHRFFLSTPFVEKGASSWTRKRSCRRKTRRRTCRLTKTTGKSSIDLSKASWSTTRTARRGWMVRHLVLFEDAFIFSFELFSVRLPVFSLPDTEMHGVYLKSVRSPAVQGKFKLSYKSPHNMDIFSQVCILFPLQIKTDRVKTASTFFFV